MDRIGQGRGVFRDVQALCREGVLGQWPDDRLVERFARERSERAFEALVDRHGPMVLRVCRAVAGDAHAAEDAFQAVFLTLARKAGSIRAGGDLGPWLRTVAVRVATNARHAESRRKRREGRAVRDDRVEDRYHDPDLSTALLAEIERLPARLREAVLTCDVEGLSYGDAALRLGWPVGTVKSRHSRGRARLRDRLVRRGIAPAAAFLAAASADRLSAAVPAALRSCAVRGALALASDGPGVGASPALAYLLLLEGTKTAMTQTMLMKSGLMLCGAALGIGATLAAVSAQGPHRAPESTRPPGAAASELGAPLAPPGPKPEPAAFDLGVPDAPPRAESEAEAVAPRAARQRQVVGQIRDEASKAEEAAPLRATTTSGLASPSEEPAEFTPEPPSNDDVWEALVKKTFVDARVHIDKVGEDAETPRVYPLAGRCQQVTVHYKGTVDYLADPKTHQRGREVVYFDKSHMRRVPAKTGTTSATLTREPLAATADSVPAKEMGQLNLRGIVGVGQLAEPAPAREQEQRLRAVEEKLDRLIKVLEADKVDPSPAGSKSKPRYFDPNSAAKY